MPERTYYHATWCGNLESIKKKGLIPRTEQEAEEMVDAILAEYGYTRKDVPRWRWNFALERLKETAGKVYLTADPMYAIQNCLAGFEAEAQLRGFLKSFREHRVAKPMSVQDIARARGDVACGICQVELDDSEVQELARYKRNWETMGLEERKRWGLETFEDYMQFLMREGINIIAKGSIPPDKIKECGCLGPTVSGFEQRMYAQRAFEIYQELGLEMPPERRERYEGYLKEGQEQ